MWPGVCRSRTATEPTCTTSPSLWATSDDTGAPVISVTHGDLVFLDVHRHVGQLEQVDQALDVLAEDVAADVVGVVVGGEHTDQAEVSGGQPAGVWRPRRRRGPPVAPAG